MRRMIAGVVLGIILGMVGQAGATYLRDDRIWYSLDRQAQTAYVAGVADSVGSIAEFSRHAGAERTIDGVRQAARCADQIPLHDLAGFGSEAIDHARRVLPSTAIIERFVVCGRSNYAGPDYNPYYNPNYNPYYWNPGSRPYYWGPGGQPVRPGRDPGDSGR